MIYEKNSTELLELIEQFNKGVPIITAFEYEAKNYKYGKEIYCNILKKQIEECFYFTGHYAREELCKMKYYQDKIAIDYEDKEYGIILTSSPWISSWLEEYIHHWEDPETQEEYKALNELLEYVSLPSQSAPTPKTAKTLIDHITHPDSVKIVDSIKIQYKNIKGKRLKLLLLAFQEIDLLPKERFAQTFYNCCKTEFDWNIASYQAMNGYEFNEITDKDELERMKLYLLSIITTK